MLSDMGIQETIPPFLPQAVFAGRVVRSKEGRGCGEEPRLFLGIFAGSEEHGNPANRKASDAVRPNL